MEEAERLCDRVAIIDHGRIIALGTNEELVRNAFASRSQVLARFAGPADRIAAWVESRGGAYVESHVEGNVAGNVAGRTDSRTDNRTNNMVQFTVEHPTEIVGLLDSAVQAGLELTDVTLRKPNLESVFLHLTGRELRD